MSFPPPHAVGCRRKRFPVLALALPAALLLNALPWPTAAQAASPASGNLQALQIAPGPLSTALNQFAQRAGLVLSFEPAMAQGKTSPGLQGSQDIRSAFAHLLAGTGLEAIQQEDGSYTLHYLPIQTGPVEVLPEVSVTAQASYEPDVLTRERLDRFPPTSTGDIFREMTGVTVANNRNGTSLDVNIRGMQGFGRVKVLVDGTESSSSNYKGYGGESTRAYVDPELLGEVKVEKGPNAGPYGAGVVGGIVSLNTLTAKELIKDGKDYGLRLRGGLANNQSSNTDFHTVGPGPGGTADISNASYGPVSVPDRTWTGSLAGAWRLNEVLELVAGISHRQSGNYLSGRRGDVTAANYSGAGTRRISYYQPGQEAYNTSQDTDSVLLKTALLLPQGQRLEFGFSRLESEFGEARSVGYPEYIEQLNLSNVDKQLYTTKYAWTPGNPWLDLRVNLWATNADEYQANDIRGLAMISGVHNAQRADTRGRGLEAWNSNAFSAGSVDFNIKYGATWLHEKVDIRPLDGDIYMDPDGKREMSSVFLQAQVQPLDSLTLDAGLRRENYEIQGEGEVSSGIPGQRLPLRINDGESRSNPSIGLAWQMTQDWLLFGRYSEGWRPPSIKETVNGLIAASNPGRTLLKPELMESTEYGIKFNLPALLLENDRFNAGLTVFHNDITDYVQGFAGEFRNAESAEFKGLEFNLEYDTGFAFARYGHTRYTSIRFCGVVLAFSTAPPCFGPNPDSSWDVAMSGLYIPPKAQHSGTLGTRLLERRLTLGARITSAIDHTGKDNKTDAGWRSYAVYDLFGSYRLNDKFSLNGSVENLRDRFYLDAGTSSMQAVPSPGRTAKLSFTYVL